MNLTTNEYIGIIFLMLAVTWAITLASKILLKNHNTSVYDFVPLVLYVILAYVSFHTFW